MKNHLQNLLIIFVLLLTTAVGSRAQSITSFSPNSGPAGTLVTVTGTNLSTIASVVLRGIPCNITPISATQASFVVPAQASAGQFRLTTTSGTVLSSSNFTVTRASSSLNYVLRSSNFNNISVGTFSTVAFTDLDHDGLVDMLVGREVDGLVSHYEQSAANSTSFTLRSANLNGLTGHYNSLVSVTDIDGDGLLDMVVGSGSGNFKHYEQSSANSTSFTQLSNDFNNVFSSGGLTYQIPHFTDIDGDGLLDLLVGDEFLSRYEQTTANGGTFTRLADQNFGPTTDAGNGGAQICVVDLDGDGLLDMLVGGSNGRLAHYAQASANSAAFTSVTATFSGLILAGYTAPAITDLDGDGLLDLLVGGADGVLRHYEQEVVIVNSPPTALALSPQTVAENVAANTTVGTLSTTDPDAGDSFTYSLVSGTGSTDNNAFNINGSSLRISASPDFETKNSYAVRVRTTDAGGLSFERAFTITVTDIDESVAPTATTTAPTNITTASATLGGNVTSDGGGTVTERGVVYVVGNGTPTTSNTKVQIGSGTGTFSQNVTTLSPGTTYSVRAYATNSVGTSYGTTQTFTTPAASVSILAITRTGNELTNAASVSFNVSFSGNVSGLSTSNFTVPTTGAVSGTSVTNVAGSGSSYTVSVNTGTGDGTVGLQLADAIGLTPSVSNTPFSDQSYTIDKTPPKLVSAVTVDPANYPTNVTTLSFRFTFDEDVTQPASDNITASTSASLTYSGFEITRTSGSEYLLTINDVRGEGEISIGLRSPNNGQSIRDLAGNELNFAGVLPNFTVDNKRPTVIIASSASSPTTTSPIPLTFTFSENVTGFVASDVTVGNGTIGGFSGSGTTYTASITPAAPGSVTVDVAANVAQDALTNGNEAAEQFSIQYAPLVAPTLTIAVTNQTNLTCNADNTGSISVAASGGTGSYAYTLNPIGTQNATGVFQNLSAGDYTVTVTDQVSGSASTQTITITQPEALVFGSPSVTDAASFGEASGAIAITASGGTGTITYSINPGSAPNTIGSFTGLVSGNYTVTATDVNLCTKISGNIFVDQPTTADLAITMTDGVSTATPGGAVTYTITASNAGPSGVTGATVADMLPASLTATWTCVGAEGGTCTASGSGNINDLVNLPSGGSVTYTVSATISASATGTLVNTATVTAPQGVTDPNTANNSATDTDNLVCPTISLTTPAVTNVACNGGSTGVIGLTASGGSGTVTYTLSPGNVQNSTGSFTGLAAGSYTVTATYPSSCSATSGSIAVTQPNAITVQVSGNTSVMLGYGSNCTDLSANASGGSGAYTYTWVSDATPSATLTGPMVNVCPEATTTYTVTATDANGCQSEPMQVKVTVNDVRCRPGNKNVTICYYGVTQCVSEKIAQRYLKLGATLGACGGNTRQGVEEAASAPLQLSLKAFPNPVQDAVTLEVLGPKAGPATFEVLDLTGRARQTRREALAAGLNEVELRLGALPSGVYLIRARDAVGQEATVRVYKE